jgi:hypothetical protein
MNRIHTLALTISLLLGATALASAANLTVTVKDVRDNTGTVLIAVYDQSGFLKPELAKAKQKAGANAGGDSPQTNNLGQALRVPHLLRKRIRLCCRSSRHLPSQPPVFGSESNLINCEIPQCVPMAYSPASLSIL